MSHADKYNILYSFQHDFKQSRSCESLLIEFVDDVTKKVDHWKQSDVLFMDYSKAFDKSVTLCLSTKSLTTGMA